MADSDSGSGIKYSIVIPHKNSFHLLLHLLDTIPANNDFQVIVVDDNSNKEQVIQMRAYNFAPNVTVYYNELDGGAGKARNVGLEYVIGKWVLFADADDYFTSEIEELLFSYYESECDMIYFGSTSVYLDTGEKAYRHERFMNLINGFLTDPAKEDYLKYCYGGPVSKMVRVEMIRKYGIKFDETIASNDIYFSLLASYHSRKIMATDRVLYVITCSKGSLMNTFSFEHFDARFKVALRANDFLRSIGKSKYQLSLLYYISRSYKFGFKYFCHFVKMLMVHRSNIFIGLGKLKYLSKRLKDRENNRYLVKKK